MVRWRYCLFLVMLMLLPVFTGPGKDDDEDEDKRGDDSGGDDEDDDEDDGDDDNGDKDRLSSPGRRAALLAPTPNTEVTRAAVRRPLECYVCSYKSDMQLTSCLEPTKYRVHTMICHSADDKCFTSVITKENSYENIVRGCRSGCTSNSETTCCELNRCNNQVLVLPTQPPPPPIVQLQHQPRTGNSCKPMPSVLFFVTILLVLQTVVKVAFV